MIKANFKLTATKNEREHKNDKVTEQDNMSQKDMKAEFEDYIIKSGAAGSFMIFRSDKKEDELGLEEL
ncbi:MAG: hypothetical protein E6K93_06435 [Thaumarchaeota archaeon]|nr:MAG: hypothetical protein E6K93_06435 [Nitrososphaerota archaeon]